MSMIDLFPAGGSTIRSAMDRVRARRHSQPPETCSLFMFRRLCEIMKPVSINGYMVHASHVEFMETYHFSRVVAAPETHACTSYRPVTPGEPGHTRDTHGTRGRTKAHGPRRRTSQPSKPTNNTHPARQRTSARRPKPRPTQQPQARSRSLPAAGSVQTYSIHLGCL